MLKILVPTDYSPEAKNACLYAYHFALYTNSRLVLYHSIPALVPSSEIPLENYYLSNSEEENLLKDGFQQLLKEHQLEISKVEVDYVVNIHNLVAESIHETAKEYDCDFILMGTHGASGFKKVFLGSNTARLIGMSTMPVLAIPAKYRFEPIYHLVYASDLENLEEELAILVPFTEVFHAALEVVYFDYAGPNSEEKMLMAKEKIQEQRYPNIKLSIQKGNSLLSLSENLQKHLNPGNTQMLIMYSGQHGWLDKLTLGSNSQKMVLEPILPILVLHKRD